MELFRSELFTKASCRDSITPRRRDSGPGTGDSGGSDSSCHIGRVGALAVALGVGTAMWLLPATAVAENTGSAGSRVTGTKGGTDSDSSARRTSPECRG